MDLVGLVVGAVLTLFVFSYLLGDTPLFRLAQAIFVGVAVGYAAVVAFLLILIPNFLQLLQNPILLILPMLGGLLLLTKLRSAPSPWGDLPIAYLFGVGAALAIGGALSGALLPQIQALIVSFSPNQDGWVLVNNVILVVGTIGAVLSFRFLTLRTRPAARALDAFGRGWGLLGRGFILIAFGAIFADTAVSRLSVLVNRVYYLLNDVAGQFFR